MNLHSASVQIGFGSSFLIESNEDLVHIVRWGAEWREACTLRVAQGKAGDNLKGLPIANNSVNEDSRPMLRKGSFC